MNQFLIEFGKQFFGEIPLPSYIAWMLLALIGAVLGILIRKVYGGLKDYPITFEQMALGFIITFCSIRFSYEILNVEPTSFGALLIGLTHNEIALMILKKYLNNKEKE